MIRLRRLLIANRGEIACRIARTARRLGLGTVAVFSDADAASPHVAACDAAVRIGPAPPTDSYLNVAAVVEAARRGGADAVHPGYGFLSENAAFAEACEAAGLVFVGPPPAAIRAMGSKSAAKALMARAGVPLAPGYHGERQDADFLQREADRIGYPLLIKASAGGGGRGMRRVARSEAFPAALASCRREASSSFGDAQVLLERYVQPARHIEIQVFGDRHGNVLHLFERDCSVQRRHQKVLEEAPAPGMTAARRAAMGAAAVEAARAVGYVGAGTVEFIVAPDGEFYFMEMNTRLQVEHPVTEMITGLDLVEWQLRVAAGEPLPLSQHAVSMTGHAIEARIYAEDPDRDFMPSSGRVRHLVLPATSRQVRVDAGVVEGTEVTPYYDPLLAKLIVWGETREAALERLRTALAATRLAGVSTNLAFLRRLAATRAFTTADLDTGLIERERAGLFPAPAPPSPDLWRLAAAAWLMREAGEPPAAARTGTGGASPWNDRSGWRVGGAARRSLMLRIGDGTQAVEVRYRPAGWELAIDGEVAQARARARDTTTLEVELDGRLYPVTVVAAGTILHLFVDGASEALNLTVVDPFQVDVAAGHAESHVRAPMPGRVVSLLAEVGRDLPRGTPLLVLEAMKMEHTIVAASDGRLEAFHVAVGQQVGEGAELVTFRPA